MVDYVSPGTATTKATDMNSYYYTTAAVQQQHQHPQSNMASRNPQDQTYAGAAASTAAEKPSNSDVTPAVPAYV